MECIFCRIIANEIPSKKVYEDEEILAFEDINPVAPVHYLIVPKEHFASVKEVDEDKVKIIGKVFIIAKKISEDKGIEDYRIVVNTGERAGQSVFHIHFHLLAGRSFNWPPG